MPQNNRAPQDAAQGLLKQCLCSGVVTNLFCPADTGNLATGTSGSLAELQQLEDN